MELKHNVKSHWMINVNLRPLHPLLHKIPQTREEMDSYYSGPSLGPVESGKKSPAIEN